MKGGGDNFSERIKKSEAVSHVREWFEDEKGGDELSYFDELIRVIDEFTTRFASRKTELDKRVENRILIYRALAECVLQGKTVYDVDRLTVEQIQGFQEISDTEQEREQEEKQGDIYFKDGNRLKRVQKIWYSERTKLTEPWKKYVRIALDIAIKSISFSQNLVEMLEGIMHAHTSDIWDEQFARMIAADSQMDEGEKAVMVYNMNEVYILGINHVLNKLRDGEVIQEGIENVHKMGTKQLVTKLRGTNRNLKDKILREKMLHRDEEIKRGTKRVEDYKREFLELEPEVSILFTAVKAAASKFGVQEGQFDSREWFEIPEKDDEALSEMVMDRMHDVQSFANELGDYRVEAWEKFETVKAELDACDNVCELIIKVRKKTPASQTRTAPIGDSNHEDILDTLLSRLEKACSHVRGEARTVFEDGTDIDGIVDEEGVDEEGVDEEGVVEESNTTLEVEIFNSESTMTRHMSRLARNIDEYQTLSTGLTSDVFECKQFQEENYSLLSELLELQIGYVSKYGGFQEWDETYEKVRSCMEKNFAEVAEVAEIQEKTQYDRFEELAARAAALVGED